MINRIKEVINSKEKSVRAFSKKIDFPYTTLNNYITGVRKTIDSDLLVKILSTYGDIDSYWLLTGRGEMLKNNQKNEVDINPGRGEILKENIITKIHKPTKYMEKIFETQEITLYDISAAANLKTLFTEKEQNILGKIILPDIPKCDGALYVRGDSMYPLLSSGDIVCYKQIYDFGNIIHGEMYLISIDVEGEEYLTIKYITRSEKGEDWICLKSFNERHSPKDFELKYVNALALIKITIRINTMV